MATDVLRRAWPEWTLEKRLGSGSYGTVYEAVRNDYGVENRGAIKVISIPASEAEVDSLRADGLSEQAIRKHFEAIVKDFVNEIRVMVSLEGRPNIVHVKDYKVSEKEDRFGWDILILMELLTPFAEHISNHPMTERDVVKLGCDICSALETCQREKIIHRDVKPGNIMIHSKSGEFKLGDFGIARKFEGLSTGLSQRYTPKYMAPEVATTNYYDARVDIYSLGIVLYQLLNKMRIPFQESQQVNSMQELDNAIKRRNKGEALPKPSDASDPVAKVILKACAFRPEDRYATAADMHRALLKLSTGIPVSEATVQAPAAQSVGDQLERTVAVRKAETNEKPAPKKPVAPKPKRKPKPLEPMVAVFDAKTEKRRRRKIGAAITVITVILLLGSLTVMFFTSTAFSVFLSMNKIDYQKALRDYRKDVKGHAVQERIVQMLLKNNAPQIMDIYDDGNLSFTNAVSQLEALDYMGVSGAEEKLASLVESRALELPGDVANGRMSYDAALREVALMEELGYTGDIEGLRETLKNIVIG